MKYPTVYVLLRERMADDNDIPDTDEIVAAALDAARDAVAGLPQDPRPTVAPYYLAALAAIDALKGESNE